MIHLNSQHFQELHIKCYEGKLKLRIRIREKMNPM